ncbi:MAG: hypothetical protein PHF86_07510 [Candidatus Nanoarchaeia archaeon]|jgi:hypothetical protein|nr:hypothetical protein [Candidatus Nanoarchaeia archaeon]
MSIQGVQIIYRLKQVVRLFIDPREDVDSFNLYYSDTESGTYYDLGVISNKSSDVPATRGKIVFEFNTEILEHWSDSSRNYIKLAPVEGGVEGTLEGPLIIPTRIESIHPKEFSVMYGYNRDGDRFLPVSVDEAGKVITTT